MGDAAASVWSQVAGATIAFLGVLASSVVAWVTSRRTIRTEVAKQRLDAGKEIAGKLLDQRLSRFPDLYSSLSTLSKQLSDGEVKIDQLRTFRIAFDSWDASNGMFFGPDSLVVAYRFRAQLKELLGKLEAQTPPGTLPPESVRTVRLLKGIGLLQDALRRDVAIDGLVWRKSEGDSVLEAPEVPKNTDSNSWIDGPRDIG